MIRILLADDEQAIVKLIETILASFGEEYAVIGEAHDGLTALHLVREEHPDVLIADIRMPGLNGIQLMEHIYNERLGTNVIVVSGYSDFAYIQKALRFGAVDYLLKPINRKELWNCLDKIKQQRGTQDQIKGLIQKIGIELDEPQVSLSVSTIQALLDGGLQEKRDILQMLLSQRFFENNTGWYTALAIKIDMMEKQVELSQNTTEIITEKFIRYFQDKGFDMMSACIRSTGYIFLRSSLSPEVFKQNCATLYH